jgi:CRP-like cAMP-binding protein
MDVLIKKLSRFLPLSSGEARAIQGVPSEVKAYGRGEHLVIEGESPDHSAVLLSGMAFRYRLLANGSRQIMALQVAGDFVDLHSFVLKPMDHSVAVAAPAEVAHVPHKRIAKLLEEFPRLAQAFLWDMALDAATFREWMVGLGRRSAPQQLAHLFCELYYRLEMAGLTRHNSFELPLSQPDLADICGLSSVHVNRSLQGLRREGLIVLERGRLTIPDLGELARAAEFDPAYLHLLSRPAPEP